jgi:hypothetical protein
LRAHECSICERHNISGLLGLRPCALVRGWCYLIFRPGHHRLLEQLVMLTLRQSRRFLVQAHKPLARFRTHVCSPFRALHSWSPFDHHAWHPFGQFALRCTFRCSEKRSYALCLLGNSRTCHSVEPSIRVHLSTFTHACSPAGTRVSDTFQYPYTTALRAKCIYCPFGQDTHSLRKSLSTLTHVRSLE